MNVNENEEKSISQCKMIKRYLLDGGCITQLDALNMFGCMRLASRIFDLRKQGMMINKKKIVLQNGKTITSYSLT